MPVTTASISMVALRSRSSLLLYPANLSTSTLVIAGSISSKVQVSTSEWIRSREPMGKWNWHFGQTFNFSSSSLSKIIVSQDGHLVHRPSGISRLRVLDLPEPSFAFLGRNGLADGGVNAGSTCSTPIADLVKNEVAMTPDYS